MPLGAHKAAIMGVAGVSTADVVLIQSQTASADGTIEFTSGFTSTYGEYIFGLYNIHPASATEVTFSFQCSIDGGSNYNVTVTNTAFAAYHGEDDSAGALAYLAAMDQGQGTAFIPLGNTKGSEADRSMVQTLHLFNPSSTTYVKHYICRSKYMDGNTPAQSNDVHTAGYFNTTDNIDAIQFKFSSGNIDYGILKMWGVK